jgi:cysteine desulfurase
MLTALDVVGNPSSVHAEGRHARSVLETAREQVARLVNAKPSEIVFTSGATEANNWVLAAGWSEIAVSGAEHDSVLVPARANGARLIELPVTRDGVACVEDLVTKIAPAGASANGGSLVCLQIANNETGVIQPVAEVAELARSLGLRIHADAVQGLGRVPIDMQALDVDFLSLSSHKIGGPKGVGALVVCDGVELRPLIVGGGQERRLRAGTENVAAVAGFGTAAECALRDLSSVARIRNLRDRLEAGVLRITPNAVIVGRGSPRLPNTSCIALAGASAETLVIKLDLAGVAVSAGAACSSGKVGESRVLKAMGLEPELSQSAIRVSLGSETDEKDIEAFVSAWSAIAAASAMAA